MHTTSPLNVLKSTEATAAWIEYLEGIGAPPFPVELPEGDAFLTALSDLSIPEENVPSLVALRMTLVETPELWWLLERAVHSLILHMDTVEAPPPFPELPGDLSDIARFFFAYVYVAMLPHTRSLHQKRGIPEAVTLATIADVGRHFVIHRAQTGNDGMSGAAWLMLHARGLIFQLGRLQFHRHRIGNRTSQAIRAAGIPCEKDDPVLLAHIPGFAGPFPPEAIDDSFAQAREFFPHHFPEETYRIVACYSWLLDPQLSEYLPESSNIVQFQRRFHQAHRPDPNNHDTLEFVFRTPNRPLDELPQNTTLERAVVSHIKSGKQWYGGVGWLEL